MPASTHYRAKVASLTRSRTPDDPELVEAKRDYRAEKLGELIQHQVDAWPPLTIEQRERLAAILRGGQDAA